MFMNVFTDIDQKGHPLGKQHDVEFQPKPCMQTPQWTDLFQLSKYVQFLVQDLISM